MSLFYMPFLLASLLCGAGGGAVAELHRHEGVAPPAAPSSGETTRSENPAVASAIASRHEAAVGRVEPAQRRRNTSRSATVQQQQTLEKILSDPTLWGKDFTTALASLPGFSTAGERRVAVFTDRVVGDVRYKTRAAAEQKARQLDRGMKSNQLRFKPQFQSLGATGAAPQNVEQLNAEAIRFLDDNTTRLAAVAPASQMLPPDLSMATVRQRLGEPSRVTKEVLDDGTERRPVILTLYHYAGGNVVFAESDIKPPGPGSVDRAYINVPAAMAAVYRR